jgi:hypothetical protein
VSSTTIVKADYWRLGQMKAGNKLKFCRVSLEDAIAKRREVEEFVNMAEVCCRGKSSFEDAFPLMYCSKACRHRYGRRIGGRPLFARSLRRTISC